MQKRKSVCCLLVAVCLLVLPRSLSAYDDPPIQLTGAPGEGTCAGCHNGGAGGGKVMISFPGGLTYTPGVAQQLTVTVSDAVQKAWGFELSPRLASNTNSPAGTVASVDTSTTVATSSLLQYLKQTGAAGIFRGTTGGHTWTFTWTPPATNVGNVIFYVVGNAANNDFSSGGDSIYTASYTVTPAVVAPSLSVTPSTLSFNYQIGGSTPAMQGITVSSSGAAVSYSVASSAAWLSASPASGSTPGLPSVSVNPSGLAAGTYNGTLTITSAGASNSPRTVAVTLTVTAAPLPTITATPSTLSFNYQIGGSTPAMQGITVSSSGAAVSYSVASSAAWLSASPASGSTPGLPSVSVNPSGLAVGTYNGTLTITSAGASNSPRTVAVTLTVTAAPSTNPSLVISPGSLSFGYTVGGAAPASQTLSVGSSGAALNYSINTTGGSWLSVGSSSGATPGSIIVTVNPSGLVAGTYNGTVAITAAGASNTPQTVPVTLVVTSSGAAILNVKPKTLWFYYQAGYSGTLTKNVRVSSSGPPVAFTAASYGGSWLTVTPAGGTTPGTVNVSVNPEGLAKGKYTGVLNVSAPGATTVSTPVILRVISGSEVGGETEGSLAIPVIDDQEDSGSVTASWVEGAGVPVSSPTDTNNEGLLLMKNSTGSTRARVGVSIRNVGGSSLTQLGFDVRAGSQCGTYGAMFLVVTMDDVVHKVGGCGKGSIQSSPASGWKRVRFNPTDPTQATPPIAPGASVKTIHVMLGEGPDTGSGLLVLDNINVNGKFIGKE